MGRLESLTAWALGRTPFEDEIIRSPPTRNPRRAQQYNEHGHPRNPETKRRERDNVRAANEVMQVTGVVEDALAARAKSKALADQKNDDTFTGLRLLEVGRGALVGGVWGVLGFRRRILLYKPYTETALIEIIRRETAVKPLSSWIFSGLPTVVAYHISDYAGFILQALIEGMMDEDDDTYTPQELWYKHTSQTLIDVVFCYITLHYRMFSILQQLNLIPGSRFFPSLKSFIPFSAASPVQLPPSPSPNFLSLASWGSTLLGSLAPMLVILIHGRVKFFVCKLLYRPVYKALPRPTGDSMFSGLALDAPSLEYDAPDRENERPQWHGEDAPTLRALEGRPTLEDREAREEERMRLLSLAMEQNDDSSIDEGDEMQQATLISFDVEATPPVENSSGPWSAELRSANEPKKSKGIDYRVTGLTMLPTFLATEGLRDIIAGVIVLPLEAIMVRIIGRAYQQSAGMGLSDFYTVFAVKDLVPASGNIFGAFALQALFTGAIWTGFTLASQRWIAKRKPKLDENGNPNP